ncbi:MAG: translation initiation factor IF-3 [Microbacterium sp.]|nr:translation initiation factor IF-3 [Microbacterium sp.]MBA4346339.1 translation initiation factor IF-3 [Microbacterium sp.]
MTTEENRISEPRTNDRIRVPEVRLVGPAGEQVGVVKIEVALRLAQEADLDLVEVAPNSKPPVVKIMDYGKFKYEAAQKAKEARRNQANTILKEVRFRLKIDKHDYETKRKRAEGFLQAGDKVKAMILFRGREQSRPEQGVRLLQRFAEDVAEFGTVESSPMIDGRNMVMIIGPLRNKADAKAEQMAQRAASKAARKVADAAPQGDAPATKPATTKPAAAKPVAEEPAAEQPAVATPAAEAPAAKTAAAKAPVAKPAAEKPAAEKPATAKPAAAKPAAAKPAAEKAAKPAAAKPAAAKPAAAKPAAAKPAAAKPAAAPKPTASA